MQEVEHSQLASFLTRVNCSRQSICEGMVLAMELMHHAKPVVDLIADAILSTDQTNRLKALLFLTSDILFNSVKVTNAWNLKKEFETHLPSLMLHLQSCGLTKQTKKLIKLWRDKTIFEARFCTGLEATLALDKGSYFSFNLSDSQFRPDCFVNDRVR